ncbi:MAG: tyrosine-type recombinase/integrase [Candidatus Woesearchaeota archaeon]
MDIIESMKKEMFRRKLSNRTILTYIFYVKKFLNYCHKNPKEFSRNDIKEFLYHYVEKNRSGNSLNVVNNALRFMMVEVLHKSARTGIRYSKTPRRIAEFLTVDEVKRLIDSIPNPNHKLIIKLMYGTGLRVSELVTLKKQDIDFVQKIGWVRGGKGNKDRMFILPECLMDDLKMLVDESRYYLFSGNKRGHYSVRSVAEIINKAVKLSGIEKNVHPHTLRHSFATHLLENGNDVLVVQALLGHSEARTTMTYLHAIKPKLLSVKSPLDLL